MISQIEQDQELKASFTLPFMARGLNSAIPFLAGNQVQTPQEFDDLDIEESLHQANLASLRCPSLLRMLFTLPLRLIPRLNKNLRASSFIPRRDESARLGGIDALRGGAMLLGIYIHSAISYMPSGLSGLAWGIHETDTSALLGWLFWWIHTFRLGLFFLLAGFFSVLVYNKKGPRGFLHHRTGRLFLPFLVGVMVLVPLTYLYCWCCGLVTAQVDNPSIWAFQIAPELGKELPSPLHLWFLEDLMIISLVYLCWRGIKSNWFFAAPWLEKGLVKNIPTSISLLLPVALALPTLGLLWLEPRLLTAHSNSFLPDPLRLLYFGYFFAIGALLFDQRQFLNNVFAWPILHLALSLGATVAMLVLLPSVLGTNVENADLISFATFAALVAWLSIFGFMGLTLRLFNQPRPWVQYLADASFWLYLCHLPLVCLLQLNCYGLSLKQELKCVLVIGGALILGLLTYQALVRHTLIGTILHGYREKQGLPKIDREPITQRSCSLVAAN